jgi:hypothetical protein
MTSALCASPRKLRFALGIEVARHSARQKQNEISLENKATRIAFEQIKVSVAAFRLSESAAEKPWRLLRDVGSY